MKREDVEEFASSQFEKTSEAMGEFRESTEHARDDVSALFDRPFEPGARFVRGYSERLEHAADSIGEEDEVLAEWAYWAADALDAVSEELGQSSPRELYGKAEDFAREQPVLFAAGAAAAGFALTRFLKSRPPQRKKRTRG